jgi:thymidine kinase
MSGKLTVITGPMGSGKTELFIRMVNEYHSSDLMVFKPKMDCRGGLTDTIASRGGLTTEAYCIADGNAIVGWGEAFSNDRAGCKFFIDEAQFIHGLFQSVRKVQKMGIDIVVSALSSDFRNLPFGEIGELLAVADEIIHVPATCARCGGTATRTYRKVENDDIIFVGGDESYEARCPKCWEY